MKFKKGVQLQKLLKHSELDYLWHFLSQVPYYDYGASVAASDASW